MARRLTIFDFDGVLVDSIREAALNAYNCVAPQFVTDLSATPPGYWELYRKNRFLIQPAGDFIPLAAWCVENAPRDSNRILSETELREILSSVSEPLRDRTTRFFASRTKLFSADPIRWYAMHEPCEPLWNFLKTNPRIPLPILTNKNRSAVLELMKHFGHPVKAEDVYSGDNGVKKIDNLKSIADRFSGHELSFIDDSIRNLLELRNQLDGAIPVTLLHANWGYSGPNDIHRADEAGIPSLSQEHFIELLGTKGVTR